MLCSWLNRFAQQHAGLFLLVWWVTSFAATHVPVTHEAPGIPHVDKLTHVVIYFGLSVLLALWWSQKKKLSTRHFVLLASILIIYAILDEYAQSFTGRNPDIWDGAADLVGVMTGLMIYSKNR